VGFDYEYSDINIGGRHMRSYLAWDSSVEEDEKIADMPDESQFECPKLNRGDIISLDIGQLDGQRMLTPVKIVSVLIDVNWDIPKDVKEIVIGDAEQHLFIEPVLLGSQ